MMMEVANTHQSEQASERARTHSTDLVERGLNDGLDGVAGGVRDLVLDVALERIDDDVVQPRKDGAVDADVEVVDVDVARRDLEHHLPVHESDVDGSVDGRAAAGLGVERSGAVGHVGPAVQLVGPVALGVEVHAVEADGQALPGHEAAARRRDGRADVAVFHVVCTTQTTTSLS
jgi:hypothetical protein